MTNGDSVRYVHAVSPKSPTEAASEPSSQMAPVVGTQVGAQHTPGSVAAPHGAAATWQPPFAVSKPGVVGAQERKKVEVQAGPQVGENVGENLGVQLASNIESPQVAAFGDTPSSLGSDTHVYSGTVAGTKL